MESNCCALGYINPLVKLEVCQKIGNFKGQGPVTCIGKDGRNFGKAGKGFLKGDDFWILMRFRRLHPGEKIASVHYSKRMGGKWMNFHGNKREWKFTNKSSSWAHWFKAYYNTPEVWRISVSVRGPDLPGYVLGEAEYTIGGPYEQMIENSTGGKKPDCLGGSQIYWSATVSSPTPSDGCTVLASGGRP